MTKQESPSQTYRITQSSAGRLYTEGDYVKQNPTWHEEDSVWKSREVLDIMSRNNLAPGSICDVGCGSGGVLRELHRQLPEHVQFTGFDISPVAHQIAVKHESDRLSFKLGDTLIEDSEGYDLVLALDVFEHVEDYFGFLRSVRRKGRYQIYHIPLDISVQRVLLSKPILRRREQVGHIHYFTKETALATLEDTGHRILDCYFTSSTLDLPASSALYAIGRIPLRIASLLSKELTARILGGYSLIVLAE